MDTVNYKCPNCSAGLAFDSKSQKMKCEYCGNTYSLEELEQLAEQQDTVKEDTTTHWEGFEPEQWQSDEKENMAVWSCPSCGAEVLAEKTTGATICPYCDNPMIMPEQFADTYRPDYVIPFKKSKKEAIEALKKHYEKKPLLPRVFKNENHIEEIKAVYVPFWLFDMETNALVTYDAERSRVWMSGDVEYTEHEFFKIERGGTMAFEHIPEDGSRKMEDDLMESLEPYDFKDAVPFKDPYLAGYVAERYDVEADECKKRAKKRAKASIKRELRDTVKGYSIVKTVSDNVKIQKASQKYALYPVWILNTTWRDQKYVFAMNGQTGKMVGDLPADKGAFWKYVVSRGLVIGVILYALMWLTVLI